MDTQSWSFGFRWKTRKKRLISPKTKRLRKIHSYLCLSYWLVFRSVLNQRGGPWFWGCLFRQDRPHQTRRLCKMSFLNMWKRKEHLLLGGLLHVLMNGIGMQGKEIGGSPGSSGN